MPLGTASTNFPNGVSNVPETSPLGTYMAPDPTLAQVWFNDFNNYTAAEWTVTESNASATQSIDDHLDAIQWTSEVFKFETGKRLWGKARFKVSDATQSDLVVGLQITDTTPLAVSDGVFFRKNDGSTTLSLVVVKDSTETVTTVTTMANDTYVVVGFAYDGVSKITAFVGDSAAASSVTTNMPDDEELAPSFAVQNGEGAVKTLSIDYAFFAKER
jgi:hypothetical protein